MIARKEYGDSMSDEGIETMGSSLLRLFALLTAPDEKETDTAPKERRIQIPAQTFNVLKYIHHAIYHDKKATTVRGIAQAAELRSSRSGMRILDGLIKRGYLYRDEQGGIRMRDDLAGCDTKLWLE